MTTYPYCRTLLLTMPGSIGTEALYSICSEIWGQPERENRETDRQTDRQWEREEIMWMQEKGPESESYHYRCVCACVCVCLCVCMFYRKSDPAVSSGSTRGVISLKDMGSITQVKTWRSLFAILHSVNSLEEGMNPTIFVQPIPKKEKVNSEFKAVKLFFNKKKTLLFHSVCTEG